jgi:hypothetical protein
LERLIVADLKLDLDICELLNKKRAGRDESGISDGSDLEFLVYPVKEYTIE